MDVKTLCLGILTRGDATGYEIKKQCGEGPFSYFYAAGFGSIYPALNSLCDANLVAVREVREEGRPTRKIYSITAAGRLKLMEAFSATPAPDRLRSDFLLMSFFGHLLSARRVDALINQRLSYLRDRLAEMHNCEGNDLPSGEAFTLGYGIAIYEAAVDYLEGHRHEIVGAVLKEELATEAGKIAEPQPATEDDR